MGALIEFTKEISA